MEKLLKNSWALFTGYGILMIAHGLQGNLLGVRAVISIAKPLNKAHEFLNILNIFAE